MFIEYLEKKNIDFVMTISHKDPARDGVMVNPGYKDAPASSKLLVSYRSELKTVLSWKKFGRLSCLGE